MQANTVNVIEKKQSNQLLSWILIVALAISLISAVALTGETKTGFLGMAIISIFTIAHGIIRYGITNMLVFLGLSFVISWSYESLSIVTGFPFGHYHYTDIMGPKLGLVPFMVPLSYFSTAYLSWTIGQVLLGQQNSKLKGSSFFTIPMIAAFIMVIWDLSADPYAATINQAWIWENGGGYFGVPFVNFLGWYLCTFTIFFTFSLFLKYFYYKKQPNITNPSIQQMLTPCVMYGVLSLQNILNIFNKDDTMITTLDNRIWQISGINEAMATVGLFTMGFIAVLSITKLLAKNPKNQIYKN